MPQKIKILTSTRPEVSSVGNEFETILGDWLSANPKIEVSQLAVSNTAAGWMIVIIYK